jgi:hypothetical protein
MFVECRRSGDPALVHTDRKQICQFATPPDWKADELTHSFWSSPDGKTTAVVSSAPDMSLDDAKGVMEGNFKPEKIFEDTGSRLWYSYTNAGKPAWYVGVATKAGVCGATLSFKDSAAEPILKQIANSVGAK